VGRGRKAAGMVARKVRRAWAADTGGVVVGGGAGCRNARSGRDGPRPETEPGSTRATRRGIAARRGDETAAGAHVSRVRRAGDASGAATARAGTGRSEAVGARGRRDGAFVVRGRRCQRREPVVDSTTMIELTPQ